MQCVDIITTLIYLFKTLFKNLSVYEKVFSTIAVDTNVSRTVFIDVIYFCLCRKARYTVVV